MGWFSRKGPVVIARDEVLGDKIVSNISAVGQVAGDDDCICPEPPLVIDEKIAQDPAPEPAVLTVDEITSVKGS